MKTLLVLFAVLIGFSTLSYAGAMYGDHGTGKFLDNIDLDEARAYEAEQILMEYKEVMNLAMRGRHDEIPAFIDEQTERLKVVLTDEEFQQFQENVGKWAEGKDFSKFKMFSGNWKD